MTRPYDARRFKSITRDKRRILLHSLKYTCEPVSLRMRRLFIAQLRFTFVGRSGSSCDPATCGQAYDSWKPLNETGSVADTDNSMPRCTCKDRDRQTSTGRDVCLSDL